MQLASCLLVLNLAGQAQPHDQFWTQLEREKHRIEAQARIDAQARPIRPSYPYESPGFLANVPLFCTMEVVTMTTRVGYDDTKAIDTHSQ